MQGSELRGTFMISLKFFFLKNLVKLAPYGWPTHGRAVFADAPPPPPIGRSPPTPPQDPGYN